MRLKWPRRGAAGIFHQHRSLHFHEVSLRQEIADLLDDLGALDKCIAHFRIHDQVQVSLTIADIGILQAVELLRKRNQILAQEGNLLRVQGHLSCLCTEDFALHADDISDIHLLESRIRFFPEGISRDIQLNIAVTVLDVREGSLPHNAFAHHAARYGYVRSFQLIKMLLHFPCMVSHVIFGNPERIAALFLQLSKLVTADLQQLVHILLLFLACLLFLLLFLTAELILCLFFLRIVHLILCHLFTPFLLCTHCARRSKTV